MTARGMSEIWNATEYTPSVVRLTSRPRTRRSAWDAKKNAAVPNKDPLAEVDRISRSCRPVNMEAVPDAGDCAARVAQHEPKNIAAEIAKDECPHVVKQHGESNGESRQNKLC